MTELIAGVDEVGVGPLAGPVVAAAVILNPDKKIYKIRDSKILSGLQRENLYAKITQQALAVSVGIATTEEIDRLNIFNATLLAMERAILGLNILPELILIDGRSKPKLSVPIKTIIRGDQTVKCIGAASIIAKVTRDRLMREYHIQYPHYHFDKHKGYSTKLHQSLLKEYGVCPIHRRSFSKVKMQMDAEEASRI